MRADGRLFLYGPFKRDGKHTALSNAVFDTCLREGNPEWGVRDIGDVERSPAERLRLVETIEMPANNLTWCSRANEVDAAPGPLARGRDDGRSPPCDETSAPQR